MTPRLAARGALLAALAAVWAVAAYLLWQSKVPSSLHLPRLDPHDYFTSSELHAVSRFARVNDMFFWGTTIIEVVALAIYARWGARWARIRTASSLHRRSVAA